MNFVNLEAVRNFGSPIEIWLVILLAAFPISARSDETPGDFEAKILPSETPDRFIPELVLFAGERMPVEPDLNVPNSWKILMSGGYQKENWGLISASKRILPNEEGWFTTPLPIEDPEKNKIQELLIKSIGPDGNFEERKIKIEILPRKRIHYVAGVQSSFTAFDNKKSNRVNQLSLTLKGGTSYDLDAKHWFVGLSGYFNLVPIAHAPASEVVARFWGVSTRIGYRFEEKRFGFTPTFSVGTYFWGMRVPEGRYGIASTYGPQFLISGKHDLSFGRYYSVYLKYAPLSNGLSGYCLSNQEVAVGGTRFVRTELLGPLLLNLDVSELYANVTSLSQQVSIVSASFGVSKEF